MDIGHILDKIDYGDEGIKEIIIDVLNNLIRLKLTGLGIFTGKDFDTISYHDASIVFTEVSRFSFPENSPMPNDFLYAIELKDVIGEQYYFEICVGGGDNHSYESRTLFILITATGMHIESATGDIIDIQAHQVTSDSPEP